MFCPSCGLEVREGLRFCNHCGAQIAADKTAPPNIVGLIWLFVIAAALVALGGLAIVFVIVRTAMQSGSILGSTVAVSLIITVLTLSVVWLLSQQISKLLTVYLQNGDAASPKKKIAGGQSVQKRLEPQKQTPISADSKFATSPNDFVQQTARMLNVEEEQQTRRLETNE